MQKTVLSEFLVTLLTIFDFSTILLGTKLLDPILTKFFSEELN